MESFAGGGEKDERDEMMSMSMTTTTMSGKSNSSESLHLSQQNAINSASQPKVASIRSRPTSSRITAAELEVSFVDSVVSTIFDKYMS